LIGIDIGPDDDGVFMAVFLLTHPSIDHAFGSRSNIDDSDTFKTLQIPNSLAALTRFCPASYF
jgi:hypothetical protein